jgi:hypothetical protein
MLKVLPMCIVAVTKFAAVCFWAEFRQCLVRQKYHSMESLPIQVLLFSMRCSRCKKKYALLILVVLGCLLLNKNIKGKVVPVLN